jgi:hypothetical protein
MGRMAKEKLPITAVVRVLKAEKIEFTSHLYTWEKKEESNRNYQLQKPPSIYDLT